MQRRLGGRLQWVRIALLRGGGGRGTHIQCFIDDGEQVENSLPRVINVIVHFFDVDNTERYVGW